MSKYAAILSIRHAFFIAYTLGVVAGPWFPSEYGRTIGHVNQFAAIARFHNSHGVIVNNRRIT
jgi:hypothetical protein